MITYSTNWMGPVATKWYVDNNIPYTIKKISSKNIEKETEYKDYVSYSGGRIDVYGLNEKIYYDGRAEIALPIMKSESWYKFTDWLDELETDYLWPLDEIIEEYEKDNNKIEWFDK